MAANESGFDSPYGHACDAIVLSRTREQVIEATRAELAHLFEQRRLLAERMERADDSSCRPASSLLTGLVPAELLKARLCASVRRMSELWLERVRESVSRARRPVVQ
jgi:hypothetical protein